MGWSPGQDDVEPGPPPRRSCSSSALAERGQHKLLLTVGHTVDDDSQKGSLIWRVFVKFDEWLEPSSSGISAAPLIERVDFSLPRSGGRFRSTHSPPYECSQSCPASHLKSAFILALDIHLRAYGSLRSVAPLVHTHEHTVVLTPSRGNLPRSDEVLITLDIQHALSFDAAPNGTSFDAAPNALSSEPARSFDTRHGAPSPTSARGGFISTGGTISPGGAISPGGEISPGGAISPAFAGRLGGVRLSKSSPHLPSVLGLRQPPPPPHTQTSPRTL